MAVIILICVNVLCFWLVPKDDYLMLSLNLFFFKGLWWQLLSSMFLHANLTHLILNMIVLFQFGQILEKFLGFFRFMFLYLLGGLICSLLSAFWLYFEAFVFEDFSSVVGASGAICVLMGFYAFLDKRARWGLLIALLLMSFVPIFMGVNIAWYAHIFGFLCGFLMAKFYVLRMRTRIKR